MLFCGVGEPWSSKKADMVPLWGLSGSHSHRRMQIDGLRSVGHDADCRTQWVSRACGLLDVYCGAVKVSKGMMDG